MATPTTTIDALPAAASVTGSQLLVVQEVGVTKHASVDALTSYVGGHITIPMTAAQISALPNPEIAGVDVQAQLTDLIAKVSAMEGAVFDTVWTGTDSPPDTSIELWWDEDEEVPPLDSLHVGTDPPSNPALELWWDTDEESAPGIGFATNAETLLGVETAKAVSPAALAYERPYFDVRSFGAKGDGATDDTTAIQAAINAATAAGGTVLFAPGTYKTSATLVIVDCDVESTSKALITSSASPAVQFGSVSPVVNLASHSLRMPKLAPVTADTGVGLKLVRAYHNQIWLPSIGGFADGVYLEGDGAGVTYNTFVIGTVVSYARNLVFSAINGGWTTQNTFIGGRHTLSQAGTALAGVRQVQMGVAGSTATRPDANTFISCSFEGNVPEYHVEFYGTMNTFIGCRFETGATGPRFAFQTRTDTTGSWGNKFVNCYQTNAPVVTSSAESYGNSFETTFGASHIDSGGPVIMQPKVSGDPIEMVLEADQDMYAATAASTNYLTRRSASGYRLKATADTNPRLELVSNPAAIVFGSGAAVADVTLNRGGTEILNVLSPTAPTVSVQESGSGQTHRLWLKCDQTNARTEITSTQSSGSTYPISFRLAATERLRLDATGVGFNGATPVAKAANPGTAAGADAAVLNAVVTALRNLGLVT